MNKREWHTFFAKHHFAEREDEPWPEIDQAQIEAHNGKRLAGWETHILRLPAPIVAFSADILRIHEAEFFGARVRIYPPFPIDRRGETSGTFLECWLPEGEVIVERHLRLPPDAATGLTTENVPIPGARYCQGLRQGRHHEGILHSLAIFYLRNACTVLEGFKPAWWSTSSNDKISHRAVKYLGKSKLFDHRDSLTKACLRLAEVCSSLGDKLIADLAADMTQTIKHVDQYIEFLTTDSPDPTTRKKAIISAQAWPFAFTEAGKHWARANSCPEKTVGSYVDWLSANYPWPVRSDPIPSWEKRQESLQKEKSAHAALKKYCDFMRQTEDFRRQIDEAASQLDAHIQHQIDLARGK